MDKNRSSFKVAGLMTSHNRLLKTKTCVESILNSLPNNWEFELIAVDDGSVDGTKEYLTNIDPRVRVISGRGTWYWAKSMSVAESYMSNKMDALLWLNDDITLFSDSLNRVENLRKQLPDSIIVGQFSDETLQTITYGGYRRMGRHPLKLEKIIATDSLLQVDTFNGNLVLVPKSVHLKVGRIDGKFSHAFADLDYGYRAIKKNVNIVVMPGMIGTCQRNQEKPPKSGLARLKYFTSTKKSPLISHIRFLSRHGGIEWPLYLGYFYFSHLLGMDISKLRGISLKSHKK